VLSVPSVLRKRMWQVGLAVAMFIATATAMNFFQSPERQVTRKSAGHDFLAFYTAGTFVRTGRTAELYDLPAVKAFEHEIVRREGLELTDNDFGPYWNPPLFAWVFAPLSRLPYHAAWNAWLVVNLICFAGASIILARIVARAPRPCSSNCNTGEAPMPRKASECDWRTWALVPLLMAVSMPFIQALGHGQNTCLSLLLVAATIFLWRQNRAFSAGIVAGLLSYKPQLCVVIAAALVLSCGWRALAGLAITGAVILAATLISLPGTLSAFLHRLPENVAWMQIEHRYLWERHVTLKAFWRLLVQGYAIGDLSPLARALYFVTLALAGACLFAGIWKLRKLARSDEFARDRLIAITIVTMPLLMPFYFDYDLLLVSAAAVLVARESLVAARPVDRRLVAMWAALFFWAIVNPAVAGATRVNGTVILLSVLAGTMIVRVLKSEVAKPATTASGFEPLRQAA
jgi:hypothetical protein